MMGTYLLFLLEINYKTNVTKEINMSNPKLMAFCNLINERKKHLSSYRKLFYCVIAKEVAKYVLTIFFVFFTGSGHALVPYCFQDKTSNQTAY